MRASGAQGAAEPQEHQLLSVRDLEVDYRARGTQVRAVNGVTFGLGRAEILGLVGESGSGKSTLGMVVAGFLAATGGSLTFDGTTTSDWRRHRGSGRDGVQMIFQDSATALNPRKDIVVSVAEAFAAGGAIRSEHTKQAVEYLGRVGLGSGFARRKPRELSGGQRQRVAIARALAARPRVLVCDESVSALDVSARAMILNLLIGIRDEEGIAMLFISHDLAVVSQLVDRILVMRKGEVCEQGTADQVINHPRHPYTQKLLNAIPRLERSPALTHVIGGRATHFEGEAR
jgi:peptide/nickel transport system ATP-binding protein